MVFEPGFYYAWTTRPNGTQGWLECRRYYTPAWYRYHGRTVHFIVYFKIREFGA